jgi:hypothetical protein
MKSNNYIKLLVIVLVFQSLESSGQAISQANVERGIELFYMAQFDEAAQILQSAVISGTLSKSDLFSAHLYIAFCRIRQNADAGTIHLNFLAAIKADPSRELDAVKTPPDLCEQFTDVRRSVLGDVMVISDPPGASVILMEPKAGTFVNNYTPVLFPNLFDGDYQLIIAKDGFLSQTQAISVMPGKVDTVLITLDKKKSVFDKINKRWLAIGGGGVLLTTAIVALLPGDNQGSKPKKYPDLPLPPGRPGKP